MSAQAEADKKTQTIKDKFSSLASDKDQEEQVSSTKIFWESSSQYFYLIISSFLVILLIYNYNIREIVKMNDDILDD